MKFLGGLLSALIAAFLPACDDANFAKLTPGQSSMETVRQVMGPPTQEWMNGDGSQTWEYPRTPEGVVNYMLDFGPNERLREVRQVLTEANFSRVKEGMTREEIRRLLGQPASEQYYELKKEYVWDWKTKSESGYDHFFDVYFDERGQVLRTGAHMHATSGN